MAVTPTGVAVIGCGLIGARRAGTAAAHADTDVRVVVDTDADRARDLAGRHGADWSTDWRDVLARDDVGAAVVCTPNAHLAPIALAALDAGCHVLIEKPMGRSLAEAESMAAAAARAGRVLKTGFNHRYHPAVSGAEQRFRAGEIGSLVQMRARYGHGSRPGCEAEWRGNADLAGGGELLDQGVHVVDLFQWLAGPPVRVQAELQTAVWPLAPLEDNAFGLLRFADSVVGQFHVSMTQWKNLFSLELHGSTGALVVEGLGGSYGTERLTVVRRNMAGGVPDVEVHEFPGSDESWTLEWEDFSTAIHGGTLRHGSPAEGVSVMRTVAALYEAGRSGRAETVQSGAVFLDRDGVLNEVVERDGRPGSPREPSEFRLVDDIDVVRRLRGAGYRVFVITNQPDLARGLMTRRSFDAMMETIVARVPVDEYAVCPHDDGEGCNCRKPLPGMIHDLAQRWQVDPSRSWVIGDMWRDVEAARSAGCTSILIRRAYNDDARPDHEVTSLREAVELVLAEHPMPEPRSDHAHR